MNSKASSQTVVVSGADAGFFGYLCGTLESLRSARTVYGFDVAVLDFGLRDDQRQMLRERFDAQVVQPGLYIDLPEGVDVARARMYAARASLPTDVPGYRIYLWIDGDAWVQDDSFYTQLVSPALDGRMAIIEEREAVYARSWRDARWHYGNMLRGFGVARALRMAMTPPINSGVWAMPGDHPLWRRWLHEYRGVVHRSGRLDMDQHALLSAMAVDRSRIEYLSGIYNWICVRARPIWDDRMQAYVTPDARRAKIAVMHLAGPAKSELVTLATTSGGRIDRRLTFAGRA